MQGERDLSSAPLRGVLALAIVAGTIDGDAEEPGLKLRLPLEGVQALDHGQEDFLANLLHIFAAQVVAKLEDKARGWRVVQVKQLVPRPGIAGPAALEQLRFSVGTHVGES